LLIVIRYWLLVPKNKKSLIFVIFRARLAACVGFCLGEAGMHGRSPALFVNGIYKKPNTQIMKIVFVFFISILLFSCNSSNNGDHNYEPPKKAIQLPGNAIPFSFQKAIFIIKRNTELIEIKILPQEIL